MGAYEFSGPGDIDRSDDSDPFWEPTSEGESGSTNARSRMWNAAAADTETDVPQYGRALGDTTVGDDDLIRHAYGES